MIYPPCFVEGGNSLEHALFIENEYVLQIDESSGEHFSG
jgi:hypothetical protein